MIHLFQKVLIFSIDNVPFDFNELNVIIEDGILLSYDELDVVVASKEGQQIPVIYNVVESKSFNIKSSYPNPFNPTTNLTYEIEKAGDLKGIATAAKDKGSYGPVKKEKEEPKATVVGKDAVADRGKNHNK